MRTFDPVFSLDEKLILRALEVSVDDENQEGKVPVSDNITIFLLPHAPKQLTNNLLWKNWTASKLGRLIVIGNSFERTCQSITSSLLAREAKFIGLTLSFVKETSLEDALGGTNLLDVFNDTSIHSFPKDCLPPAAWVSWNEAKNEPHYVDEDLEYIRK